MVSYFKVYDSVVSSHKAAGSVSDDDVLLARKLVLIVLTDFVCWVPIIVMSIASLCGIRIEDTVSAWVAIIVLPINSSLNPVLYTIANIDCKSKKKRKKNG